MRSEELTIHVPGGRSVRLKSSIDPEVIEDGGRLTYRWVHSSDGEEDEEDEDASPYVAPAPDVQLSSFLSWKDVGVWTAQLMDDQAVPNDRVSQKAEELTEGIADPLEKARRIYAYVTREFRYLSISYGLGRYQPHAADEVLAAGYGDCKDKHSLLSALLAAVGIDSHPALIGHGLNLEPEVPSPAQFNHVITRASIDGEGVWLDSTVQVTPFRYLTPYLLGKQALLVDGSESRLVTVPSRTPLPDRLAHSVDGSVDPDGTLKAEVVIEMRGRREYDWRTVLAMAPRATWEEIVFDALEPSTGDISNLSVSELTETEEPLRIAYDLAIDSFLSPLTQEQSVKLPLPNVPLWSDDDLEKEWVRDLWVPHSQESSIELQVPLDYELSLPVPVDSNWEFGSYRAEYELHEDGTLFARRRLVMDQLPEPGGALGAMRSAVTADARQQLAASIAGDLQQLLAAADIEKLATAADAAWKQEDYGSSADLYRRVVELEPEHESGWYRLGYSLSKQGRYEDGVAAFREHREIEPYHERVGRMIAWALDESGDTDAAIEEYKAQLDLFPLDDYALAQVGRILEQEGRCEEALGYLKRAVAINSDNMRSRLRQVRCHLELSEDDLAFAVLDRLLNTSNDALVLSTAGQELASHEFFDRAIQFFEKTTSLYPQHEYAFDHLGWAHFEAGHVNEALAPLRRQIEIDPNHWRAHLHLGSVLAELGHLEAAWESFGRHLEIDSENNHDRVDMFQTFVEHDEWQRGLAALEPVVESWTYVTHLLVDAARNRAAMNPETEQTLRQLVDSGQHSPLAELALSGAVGQTEGLDAAVEVLRRLVGKHPEYPSVLSHLGIALFHLDQREESRELLSRALEQNPEDVLAHRGLGLVAAGEEEYEGASRHLGLVKVVMEDEFPDQNVLDFVEAQLHRERRASDGDEPDSPPGVQCQKDPRFDNLYSCQPTEGKEAGGAT